MINNNIDFNLKRSMNRFAEMCRVAGAAASTMILSSHQVVIFYKDPQSIPGGQGETFDELHINHQQNACILIAVFPVDAGNRISPDLETPDQSRHRHLPPATP